MAEKTKSLVTWTTVFVGGLAIGTLLMTGVIAGASGGEEAYVSRTGLGVLSESPRVEVGMIESGTKFAARSSDPLTAEQSPTPVRLVIQAIDVDARVTPVGLEPSSGDQSTTVAVPGLSQAGWYEFGAVPDQPGAMVLAGHVDLNGLRGVFWSLDELSAGDVIDVYLSDESVASYRVMRGTTFSRDALPSEELFRSDGPPALHLITCGGAFNQNLGSYESNFVITAAPIYNNA